MTQISGTIIKGRPTLRESDLSKELGTSILALDYQSLNSAGARVIKLLFYPKIMFLCYKRAILP
jgi:hypothetical protein